MPGWRGGCLLVVGSWLAACLAGCLDAPVATSDGPGDGDGGSGPGDDGAAGGPDSGPPPTCDDGTSLAIVHVSEIQLPPGDGKTVIPLDGLAVFVNDGSTTIGTEHLEIAVTVTVGSADLDLAIADTGKALPPGESHGFLDATSRPLMMEMVEGFWSDQTKPDVFGSISHVVLGGTFEAYITYQLGELEVDVTVTFDVNGGNGAVGGMRFASFCAV